jgi:acyl transferase domain-containing protein
MLAIAVPEALVAELIADCGGHVSLAAVNGPSSVVVSGDEDAIGEVELRAVASGYKTSRLRVSHAFHSALMEPMLDEFRSVAQGIAYDSPRLPVVSNESGELAADAVCDPEYWVRQVRGCVRFSSRRVFDVSSRWGRTRY